MIKDGIRPSSEIDAWCTKCRAVTNHRVIAMVEGVVKRVICETCDSQHNYRPPPGHKPVKGAKAKRVAHAEKRVRQEAGQPFQKWVDLKAALPEPPRLYKISETFGADEAIDHPTFGIGFVIKLLPGDKIEVMFETEIKLLAMNRQMV